MTASLFEGRPGLLLPRQRLLLLPKSWVGTLPCTRSLRGRLDLGRDLGPVCFLPGLLLCPLRDPLRDLLLGLLRGLGLFLGLFFRLGLRHGPRRVLRHGLRRALLRGLPRVLPRVLGLRRGLCLLRGLGLLRVRARVLLRGVLRVRRAPPLFRIHLPLRDSLCPRLGVRLLLLLVRGRGILCPWEPRERLAPRFLLRF